MTTNRSNSQKYGHKHENGGEMAEMCILFWSIDSVARGLGGPWTWWIGVAPVQMSGCCLGAALSWLHDGLLAGFGCSSLTLRFSWTVTLIILGLGSDQCRTVKLHLPAVRELFWGILGRGDGGWRGISVSGSRSLFLASTVSALHRNAHIWSAPHPLLVNYYCWVTVYSPSTEGKKKVTDRGQIPVIEPGSTNKTTYWSANYAVGTVVPNGSYWSRQQWRFNYFQITTFAENGKIQLTPK